MISEAIILAGGLGTRLRSVVSDLPKSMADVNGKPFLHYLFVHMKKYNISKVVLSVGYMAEKVEEYFSSEYLGIKVEYAHEKEALGTGGGIRLAMGNCSGAHVLAMNGDSFFNVPLDELAARHVLGSSIDAAKQGIFLKSVRFDATLALRKVEDASRYGTVDVDNHRITAFREKDPKAKGAAYINGGVYALRRQNFLENTKAGEKFSIEYDFFGKLADKLWLQAFPCDGYFIDIGVPEDYARAQKEFGEMNN